MGWVITLHSSDNWHPARLTCCESLLHAQYLQPELLPASAWARCLCDSFRDVGCNTQIDTCAHPVGQLITTLRLWTFEKYIRHLIDDRACAGKLPTCTEVTTIAFQNYHANFRLCFQPQYSLQVPIDCNLGTLAMPRYIYERISPKR